MLVEELNYSLFPTDPYFVDFLRDAPEPTGDEPDDADLEAPKIYEQVHLYIIQLYIILSLFV